MVKNNKISMKNSTAAYRLSPFTTLCDEEDWNQINLNWMEQ
jgi:hypothetical protein